MGGHSRGCRCGSDRCHRRRGVVADTDSATRARLNVVAYRDPTGHITAVVENERGTQEVKVRSVSVVRPDGTTDVAATPSFRAPVAIAAGSSEQWSFDARDGG
jgi:hypothetical protein